MSKSYLAIIDSGGMESIYEEHEGTAELLGRQFGNPTTVPRMLVWAVISNEVLLLIINHLRLGHRQDAWHVLQTQSHRIGSLATSDQFLLRA